MPKGETDRLWDELQKATVQGFEPQTRGFEPQTLSESGSPGFGLEEMVEFAQNREPRCPCVLLLDTSGSMHGTSINQAKEALLLGLAGLKPGDSFNIVQFNSTTTKFMPGAIPADADNLRRAKNYVQSLRANGGTEMAAALRAVLNGGDDASRVRQVIFLTDGSVGNERCLFTIIGKNLGDSRLFTVGIGAAQTATSCAKRPPSGADPLPT